MIALLALCDVYDSKYLPAAFVNKKLGYKLKDRRTLISVCSEAESLICRSSENDIELYNFKHKLLSELYLKLYTEPEGGPCLYRLAETLIDYSKGSLGTPEQEYVLETLLNILIRNKDRDINDLSQLLADIADINIQRSLVCHLAKQFQPEADRLLDKICSDEPDQKNKKIISVLRLVSHAYAHLGKLYAKPPENYREAAQCFALAAHHMPNDDPFIFHMHGNVLYHQIQKEWEAILKNGSVCADGVQSGYEERVDEALLLFEKTCECGDMQYGLIGQLNLLFEYLRFIYRANNIQTKEDIRRLSTKQLSYQARLIEALDTAEQYDEFDEGAVCNIRSKRKQLYSEVLMGNIGKTIEFYQNEYDKLRSNNDVTGAMNALQGLVSARIQRAKAAYEAADSKSKSFYQMILQPQTLLNQIGTLLQGLYNKKGYYAYEKRTSLFRHWFQIAKLLDCPVNEAEIQAKYWVETEDEMKGRKNPEPYYYKAMLLCLDRLDGMECEGDLQAVHNTIRSMDANQLFDPKRGRLNKVRDLLVDGHGMGRLLNVSDCGPAVEIANRISEAKKSPTVLCGTVESVDFRGAELSVYAPPALAKQKVLSEVGKMSKNTLSENQLNHKVMFFAGFSAIGIKAISDSVKDQDAEENFDMEQILREMSGSKGTHAAKLQKGRVEQAKSSQNQLSKVQVKPDVAYMAYDNGQSSGADKIFYPKWVKMSKDEPLYLNGEVDDGIAGVSVRYLIGVFGERAIDAYGGIHNILNTLIHQVGRMDVIIENAQEYNGQRRYTLRLRDENIELSQLLQIQQTPKISSEVQAVDEDAIPLPNFNGKQVTFIPLDNNLSKKDGKFLVDGIEYSGIVTNIKTSKDRKKAQKYNGMK